jgi:hypothetical protein
VTAPGAQRGAGQLAPVDAALLLLERMGVSLEDLTAAARGRSAGSGCAPWSGASSLRARRRSSPANYVVNSDTSERAMLGRVPQ